MKSEPDVFSLHDLMNAENQTTKWEGVRNYEARNFMRDKMKIGDGVLFYHSNATPPHIAGLAEIVSESYPDPTQFESTSEYYDPKSTVENPRWFLVDVKFSATFTEPISRDTLSQDALLKEMMLFKRNRLSITPVTEQEWIRVLELSVY
jgi:predicted RNA-binding protein with PUA-like domain